MKAEQVKAGDQLVSPQGDVQYVVEDVAVNRPHVVATVRFTDGGNGQRMWEIGKDVPLTRPTQ